MAIEKKSNIRARRTELGLTQAVVAEQLGISVGLYNMLENGKRRMNETYLNGLSEILKVSPSALLDEAHPQLSEFIDEFARLANEQDREQVLDYIRFLRARREAT